VIIIAGTIDVPAGHRSACLTASEKWQRNTRDDEPGCLAYCFAPDPLHDDRIQVYELWTDQPSLAAHFLHPNYLAMREVFAAHGPVKSDNKKYRVDHAEPVYDAERKPRADWFQDPRGDTP
jgi:quinol monooxygenase YgiN